jgi:hypothetical protein
MEIGIAGVRQCRLSQRLQCFAVLAARGERAIGLHRQIHGGVRNGERVAQERFGGVPVGMLQALESLLECARLFEPMFASECPQCRQRFTEQSFAGIEQCAARGAQRDSRD